MGEAWSKITIMQSGPAGYRVWFERVKTNEVGLTSTDVLVRELEEGDRNMVYLMDALFDVAYPHPPAEGAEPLE